MGAEAVLAEVGMPQDVKSFGVRTGSQGRHFRRPASESPSPRHRAGPPLPSYAPPSGGPPAELRSPAVARCCGLGAKAPHATPPPCPRPPGLGAPLRERAGFGDRHWIGLSKARRAGVKL